MPDVSPSILLIDDEKSFRVILESALTSEGYHVRTAADVRSARQVWSEGAADLVIVDRNLPDGDGVELLDALKREAVERNLDTTFLVVTAYADVDNAVLALKHGADDYITKPVQLPDLLVKLRKGLERRALERRVQALRRGEPDVVSILRRTKSQRMARLLEMAERVAASPDTPVLVQGESGTGKDLVARFIHALTPGRADSTFVELNCAAISEQLAESELFGHERGAFTDAKAAKRGLLELADGGTVFLDEIADLGSTVQAKLLRVLETMRFRRVGGTHDRTVDVRVISATHRDLAAAVEDRTFRLDLYHRLDVFHLVLPALRERPEDILPLAQQFMTMTSRRLGRPLKTIAKDAADLLLAYPFPGNVRELRNVIERAVILEPSAQLTRASIVLGPHGSTPPVGPGIDAFLRVDLDDAGAPPSLREVEAAYVARVLAYAGWNKTRAAKLLGVTFPTIQKKIQDYDLG
ncbi:MAG: sigma-54-dependent Fis family transcriptional regulator [Myxococcales bacterium]|nr:sigma-54-dependent Fis family transcriptional regulator [Myxococcales bacterium]